MEGWGNSAYDNDVRTLVFGDGLIAIDKNGAPNPGDMVESYEANEDQTQWTFKLKEGVKFSNGDELTADDEAELRSYVREILIIYWDISITYEIYDPQEIKALIDSLGGEANI